MKINHYLIDMDGVLSDFVGHFLITFGYKMPTHWPKGEFSMGKVLGIGEPRLWQLIGSAGAEYWENMPKTPFADELMSLIVATGTSFTISTSPSKDPASVVGKIRWLRKNVPALKHAQLMIGSNKALMAKPDVALIDDSDKNLCAFIMAGGIGIPVPMPWNVAEGEPLEPLKMTLRFAERTRQ